MSKTPLVDSLGVFVEHAGMPGAYVSAHDLEACLEKLPKVSCNQKDFVHSQYYWGENVELGDTHTARLLGVAEIKREPVKVIKE